MPQKASPASLITNQIDFIYGRCLNSGGYELLLIKHFLSVQAFPLFCQKDMIYTQGAVRNHWVL